MVLNQLQDMLPPRSFSLNEIDGFPVDTYQHNLSRYQEYEKWYDGTVLEETKIQGKDEVELYPVKINPIKGAVTKHAAVLFGDVVDDGRPLVVPRLIPRVKDEASKTLAMEAEEVLNMLWYENNGRALQLRAGILSQYLGGCVFKISYVPWETWRTIPLRIELLHPRHFVGVADASDFWRLRRGWVARPVSAEFAQDEYNVKIDDKYGMLVEDWRRPTYKITIDGKVAHVNDSPRDGVNPFGAVPLVYIPHFREKSFYGTSMIDGLEGLIREMNLRAADFGDAVSDDAHSWLAMVNVSGTPRILELAEGLKILDLKSAPSVTGNAKDPNVFPLKQNSASDAMGKLYDKLYQQFRRDANIPAVADGEDEGSQRSAMTLAFRMWPLASHVTMERILWTTGLNWGNTMALQMMAKPEIGKKMVDKGLPAISEQHLGMRMRQDFAPMFPRDREAIINEIAMRVAAHAGSIDTMLELTGDVEDIPAEKKKILQWLKDVAKAQAVPVSTNMQPQKKDEKDGNKAEKSNQSAGGNKQNAEENRS